VADLKKVSRILLDLKVTENYLRQYPHLAEKIVAAVAKSFEFFNYYLTLVVTPMFLFCGVFFPLESLPRWAQALARVLPLTYAVRATHALMQGRPELAAFLPLLWLIPAILAAFLLAARLVRRRLIH